MNTELNDHPGRSFINYLIDGFVNGFDTGFSRLPECSFECKNLQSAKRYPVSTSELIETELNKGYIIGPFDTIPFSHYRISPGGARWLSGRVSDSGARGPGFETYRRRVVSLSKILYSPKVLVNYPGSDGCRPDMTEKLLTGTLSLNTTNVSAL